MNLLEYEAKQILATHTIPVASSVVIKKDTDAVTIPAPFVVKSQVPTGGRGKLGGIRIVETVDELARTVDELFALSIKGHLPATLLIEEKIAIARELYISLLIDRESSSIQLVAHATGGVEVEENNPDEFLRLPLHAKNSVEAGEMLAEHFGLPGQTFVLQDIVKSLYECFVKHDATLIEINPLILTHDNVLIAGDCKMVLDDAAAFRHPEWDFEAKQLDSNFVVLHERGEVATIANGAGLAMATVDAVADAGMIPANFLDIGGGANAASVLAAFRRILEYPNIKAIVINIFAGITRCDEIAKAIIEAKQHIDNLPPLCIRLEGTNYDEAKRLLDSEGIELIPTLKQCIEAAQSEVTHE